METVTPHKVRGVNSFIHVGEWFLLLSGFTLWVVLVFLCHISLVRNDHDSTPLKNNKGCMRKKKVPQRLQGHREPLPRTVCCSSKTVENGSGRRHAGLSQAPVVRPCFIFGPSTEFRKPHPLTSFPFKILHSSLRKSPLEFSSNCSKREKEIQKNRIVIPKKTALASKRLKQVVATHFSLVLFYFSLRILGHSWKYSGLTPGRFQKTIVPGF